MPRARIGFRDQDGNGSTTATVVWAHNHLNQRRQFATDGVRFFYQPGKRDSFVIVNERNIPAAARKTLDEEHHRHFPDAP